MTSLKNRQKVKEYVQTKRGHVGKLLANAKRRAKQKNLDFDLDLNYLESITTNECPIFKTPFVWGRYRGRKKFRETPSLDRIIPELGYVKNNVVFISHRANSIKNNATERELYDVADWLHERTKEVLNAIKKQTAQLSKNHH
jgi:hypothetical protein